MITPCLKSNPIAFAGAILVSVALLPSQSPLWGQSASAGATTAVADAKATDTKEAVIELPPFEVRTEKDEGYLAQNTASGSRLNSRLKDTPAPISVFTPEFMSDIGATNIAALSEYAVNTGRLPGFENGNAAGNNVVEFDAQFRIRGLAASGNAGRSVDFFKYNLEVDTYNTERVEFARGPNAILFGIGASAGNFNISTKKADVSRALYTATARGDSNHGLRFTLDLNQPVIKGKLAVRMNLLKNETNSWRPHEFNDSERIALAARYQITPRTTLDVGMEKGHVNQSNNRPWVGSDYITDWIAKGRQLDPARGAPFPTNASVAGIAGAYFVYDSKTGAVANWQNMTMSGPTSHFGTAAVPNGEIMLLQDFSLVPKDTVIAGPGAGSAVDYYNYSAFFRHELAKKLFIELAFNKQDSSYLNRDVGSANLRILYDTNAQLPDGTSNPNAGKPYVEGVQSRLNRFENSDSYRATASYEIELGQHAGKHLFAFLAEQRNETNIRDNQVERIAGTPPVPGNPENASNNLRRRTYVNLSGPAADIAIADFRLQPLEAGGGPITTTFFSNGQNASYDYKFKFTSLMVALQSRFLNERLITTAGYRNETADAFYSRAVRGAPQLGYTLGFFQSVRNTTPSELDAITRSIGGVYHVTKQLSLVYNRSSNVALPNPQIVVFPGGPPPTTKGESTDYGVKITLLAGKLFATITRYETSSLKDSAFTNQGPANAVNDIWTTLNNAGILAANGIVLDSKLTSAGGNSFDLESEGYEFELVANPVRNWRLSLNYAQNKSVQSNIDRTYIDYLDANAGFFTEGTRGRLVINSAGVLAANAIDAGDAQTTIAETLASAYSSAADNILKPDGAQQTGSPTKSANLRTNYTFSEGALSGYSIGGGVRWRGKPVIGYTSSDPATRQLIWGDETTLVDANIGYRRNLGVLGRKVEWSLQLNINNLLNEEDIVITGAFTDGAPRQYVLQAPREFMVTSTFKF